MADITMCNGKDYPFKESCYRFTAEQNRHRQSYFIATPYNKDKNECVYYWDNKKENK